MTVSYDCPLQAAFGVIGGKWKPPILSVLAQQGPTRFGQLRREVEGITEKVLAQHLREMEADGLLVRTDHGEVPPHVDYALTVPGRSLLRALDGLSQWGTRHMGHRVAEDRVHT